MRTDRQRKELIQVIRNSCNHVPDLDLKRIIDFEQPYNDRITHLEDILDDCRERLYTLECDADDELLAVVEEALNSAGKE